MHMIGHQAIPNHANVKALALFTQALKIARVVVGGKENVVPVVPTLRHVVRQMRNDDSGSARHDQDHNRNVQHVLEIGGCLALSR